MKLMEYSYRSVRLVGRTAWVLGLMFWYWC